jgi:hypothetical protein
MSSWQFIVPATIRKAELYELSGDLEAAVKSYERVPVMWSGADEALQPIVDQARERRVELLVRLGREPASLPSPSADK